MSIIGSLFALILLTGSSDIGVDNQIMVTNFVCVRFSSSSIRLTMLWITYFAREKKVVIKQVVKQVDTCGPRPNHFSRIL